SRAASTAVRRRGGAPLLVRLSRPRDPVLQWVYPRISTRIRWLPSTFGDRTDYPGCGSGESAPPMGTKTPLVRTPHLAAAQNTVLRRGDGSSCGRDSARVRTRHPA